MRYLVFFFLLLLPLSLLAQDDEAEKIFSIYFGGGSYYIDQKQVDDLYDFLDEIENIDACEIEIHGHTDNIGSLEYNKYLSMMRSNATLDLLIYRNIPQEKIKDHSFGEESPLFSNRTFGGKLRNRRVDVIIKKLAS